MVITNALTPEAQEVLVNAIAEYKEEFKASK